MMTPEGKVKLDISRWLKGRGYWWFKPVSNGMGKHGIPDFVGCKPIVVTPDMVGKTVGIFFGIEAKAVGNLNGTTPSQDDRIAEINEAGGCAYAVDRVDMMTTLEKFDGYS